MEFINLNEKEYRKFYNSYEDASFMQSIELGNLKKEYDDPFVSGRLGELECVIEIVKKEGRLNVWF